MTIVNRCYAGLLRWYVRKEQQHAQRQVAYHVQLARECAEQAKVAKQASTKADQAFQRVARKLAQLENTRVNKGVKHVRPF